MSIKAKGSEFFFSVDNGTTVLKFACPTGINGLGFVLEMEEELCLDDDVARKTPKKKTLNDITIPFLYQPTDDSHEELVDMLDSATLDEEPIPYLIGWPDGVTDPTLTGGAFTAPTGRTSVRGIGYISSFNIDFTAGEKVSGTMVFSPNSATVTKKA